MDADLWKDKMLVSFVGINLSLGSSPGCFLGCVTLCPLKEALLPPHPGQAWKITPAFSISRATSCFGLFPPIFAKSGKNVSAAPPAGMRKQWGWDTNFLACGVLAGHRGWPRAKAQTCPFLFWIKLN